MRSNFYPVSNDHWTSHKSNHNVMFTVSFMNKNQIFGVDNILQNTALTCNIVCNKDDSLLYFIEKGKVRKLIDSGVLNKVENIDFPDEAEIIK